MLCWSLLCNIVFFRPQALKFHIKLLAFYFSISQNILKKKKKREGYSYGK
ncbi:hypothetical protein LSP03_13720 [Lysinibacillus sphaericus]|nr:hypothetical protein LSP03_13720 [Lysinibacillus sphaericus]